MWYCNVGGEGRVREGIGFNGIQGLLKTIKKFNEEKYLVWKLSIFCWFAIDNFVLIRWTHTVSLAQNSYCK
jgi:hypothetical protein